MLKTSERRYGVTGCVWSRAQLAGDRLRGLFAQCVVWTATSWPRVS